MTGVYKQRFHGGEGKWEWGHLQSELLTKFCDPRIESVYGFYLCLTPVVCRAPNCGLRSKGKESRKVTRKGERPSCVDEGSETLRTLSKFCFVSPVSPGQSWQALFMFWLSHAPSTTQLLLSLLSKDISPQEMHLFLSLPRQVSFLVVCYEKENSHLRTSTLSVK